MDLIESHQAGSHMPITRPRPSTSSSPLLALLFSGVSVSSASARPEEDWAEMAPSASGVRGGFGPTSAEVVAPSAMVNLILRRLGLGKVDLASALAVTWQTIYGWLKGAHVPDARALAKISALYAVASDLEQPLTRSLARSVHVGGATLLQRISEEQVDPVTLRRVVRQLAETAASRPGGPAPERSKKERAEHLYSALSDALET